MAVSVLRRCARRGVTLAAVRADAARIQQALGEEDHRRDTDAPAERKDLRSISAKFEAATDRRETTDSFSGPSLGKPREAVADWLV